LLYKAYEAFFLLLPKAANGEAIAANILIGAIDLVLVIAALILAWDAYQAFQRYRKEAAKPAKAKA